MEFLLLVLWLCRGVSSGVSLGTVPKSVKGDFLNLPGGDTYHLSCSAASPSDNLTIGIMLCLIDFHRWHKLLLFLCFSTGNGSVAPERSESINNINQIYQMC